MNNHRPYRSVKYPVKPPNQSIVHFIMAVVTIALIFFIIVFVFGFWQQITLPEIRDITPAEKVRASAILDKFALKSYFSIIDQATGEISYYRGGRWMVIK